MIHFRPFPGLTIICSLFLAILLSLGTWQYQRLDWKTALLADIETASKLPPIESLEALLSSHAKGEPLDYRRISVTAQFAVNTRGDTPNFFVFKVIAKKTHWRIFRPVQDQDTQRIFVALETISDAQRNTITDESQLPATPLYISGYVRTYEKPSRFSAKSTPALNRWFSFNAAKSVLDWGDSLGASSIPTHVYIDAVTASDAPNAQTLPIRKPDIPNNHFDYMLTWYSFALIVLIIYGILHMRAGRLSLRK